ncbi:hemolysin III family protein [Maribacter cobaltidurans]|uniref:Hemolysin III family protein n=2 Tax=Maribacter cobaltidurans TaxID=1178778 RepID=A0A223V287_9FLAO|nr:hemolysin III family protein [Maribacter cobaltidurans]GGD73341.1 hemolysin D [Maribacter cobaltidurans]
MEKFTLPKEEIYNSVSHLAGTLFSIIGFIVLLNINTHKTKYSTISIVIYSITLISMFLVSSFYHIARNERLKMKLRILDHINIYYLIAGTYTPVALITLVDGNGFIIFCTVWIIATIGTVLKIFYTGKYEIISLLLYLGMGWLIVLDFQNLLDNTTELGTILLFLGGMFYTIGIIFYAIHRIPFNHFIWHLFVLAGAVCHWFFIYLDVV